MKMVCTVDDNRACQTEMDWEIYIPEEDDDNQKIGTFSLAMTTSGGEEFACANMGEGGRDMTATEATRSADSNGNVGQLALGGFQLDELGYSHVTFTAILLTASHTYRAHIADGPCSSLFAKPSQTEGLSTLFTTDSTGINRDVSFFVNRIVGPAAESLVVSDAGTGNEIMCYDMEIITAVSRSSSSGGGGGGNGGVAVQSACHEWAELYRGTSSPKSWKKYNGKGKAKVDKGKKGKYRAFAEFTDTSITDKSGVSLTRCCLQEQYAFKTGKGSKHLAKMSALTWGQNREKVPSSFYVGIGSGVAGFMVLAAGVVMHIRRTRREQGEHFSFVTEKSVKDVTEATPLNRVSQVSDIKSKLLAGDDEGFEEVGQVF